MKINLQHGLPMVSLALTYRNQSIILPDVLFDTGCAATVFDTDALARIGVYIDFINGRALNNFPVQLGSIQESYGFDGILGIDFLIKTNCKADFETMEVTIPS